MSTRRPTVRGFGWLLLLGGLSACGYDVPWLAADAAGPAGRSGETPDIGDAPEPDAPAVETSGALAERFTKKGYGAAWAIQPADLDGDGVAELIYGGHGVVAIGKDDKPLWSFDLPSAEPTKGYEQREYEQNREPTGRDEPSGDDAAKQDENAEKLGFFGVHVRSVKAAGGYVYVLDSNNRVHVLDGGTGELHHTTELAGEGNACDLALFDGDGDGIADYLPSGGTTAYAGKDGEKLFEVDVDFTPTMAFAADIDGERGREIVLVAGEEKDICPAEMKVLAAMDASKGQMAERGREDRNPRQPGDIPDLRGDDGYEGLPAPERDRERDPEADPERDPQRDQERDQERDPQATYGYAVLDREGMALFEGEANIGAINDAKILPGGEEQSGGTLVLAGDDGIVGLGMDGAERWNVQARDVKELLVADLDGNGTNELVAHALEQDTSTLYGIGADGKQLWNADLDGIAYALAAADLDGDGKDELLTSIGTTGKQMPREPQRDEQGREEKGDRGGFAREAAWTVGEQGPEPLWSHDALFPARGFATAGGEGERRLYVAGGDGTLHIHDAASGETSGEWYAGSMNHAIGAGDLDGDGMAETVTGDIFGNLTVTSSDGKVLQNLKIDADGPVVVTGIAVSGGEDGKGLILASGFAWNSADKGVLAGFDAAGNELFVTTAPNALGDVKLADLDGNGTDEIVAASFAFRFEDRGEQGRDEPNREEPERDAASEGREPIGKEACGVAAYDAKGAELWNTPVSDCDVGRIAVGDVDGDGALEVAYGDLGRNGPFHVALIDGAGEVRFDTTNDENDAVWLAIVEGGVAYGGRAGGDKGHVTMLDDAGEEMWTIEAGGLAKDAPEMEDSPFGAFAGSLFGVPIDDRDGDGTIDLAYTTVDGDLAIVSSMSGEAIEETNLGQLVGGPIAWIGGERGGTIVAAGYDLRSMRSGIVAFDVENAEVIGEMQADGLVAGIVSADFGGGKPGFSVATTFDTYGIDVKATTEDRRPLPEEEPDRGDVSLDEGSED